MTTGLITAAQRDESEEGTVQLEQGVFHRYLVEIKTDSGEMVSTDVLRKPKDGVSTSPKDLEVEQKPNGRWKVAQKNGGGFSGGGRQTHPEDAKRMARCHSQQMALRYIGLKIQLGIVQGDFTMDKELKPIIDWFEKDIGNG